MGGLVAISWVDLVAWNAAVGANLSPWELETVRFLSMCYCDSAGRAKAKDCPAPHMAQINKNLTSDTIKAAFRSIARPKKRA